MNKKRALVGLHNPANLKYTSLLMKAEGFKVTKARTLDEMLQAMGVLTTGSGCAMPKNLFTHYFMDVNLGSPNSKYYSPAQRVYDLVKSHVESGEAKFSSASNNFQTVKLARAAGIPVYFGHEESLRILLEEI